MKLPEYIDLAIIGVGVQALTLTTAVYQCFKTTLIPWSEFEYEYASLFSSDLINSRGNRQALFNDEGLTKDAIAKRRNTTDNTNKFDRLVDGGLLINFDDTGSNLVKTSDEDKDIFH